MGENFSEFLPIAILGNRSAVLIKIEILEIPNCRIHFYCCLRQGNLSAKGCLPDLGLFFTERLPTV
jgi:hypothetical protein